MVGFKLNPISKPEVSVPINCWVTSDPAKSHILPGQNMLCTYASEYNPYVFKEKSEVSVRFLIEIQQILCASMYVYRKGFFENCVNKNNWRMWGFTSKSTNDGRDILSGE